MFILFGKIFYSIVWLFLFVNLIHPYPTPANVVAYVGLLIFALTHGLQAWILYTTMTSQEKREDKFKPLRLFIFGFFESLSWKNKK